MDLSVIIPVYNGEHTLSELYRRIRKALDGNFVYEIIFVNDAGKGNNWDIIQELIGSDPSIARGFNLKQNYGQHNAILFGMTKAYGDFIITLDEDLQHDPESIGDLIITQKEGKFDVVYGKFEKMQHPAIRVKTSEALRLILKASVPGLYPYYSPYRLIKKEIAQKITILKNSYCFIDGYIGLTTNKIGDTPVRHYKRAIGESSYSYSKLLKHGVLIILAFSKVITWLLITSFVLCMSAVLLILTDRVRSNPLTGKAEVVLLSLGILFLLFSFLGRIINRYMLLRNIIPAEFKYR